MRNRLLCLLAACLVVSSACSSDASVKATMDEYSISVRPASGDADGQAFTVRNVGSVAHQLLFLRTDRPADALPVKDGLVRTGAKGIRAADEFELVAPGASEKRTLDLSPGNYVLICNIAGHYTSGMLTSFRAIVPSGAKKEP